MSRTNTTPRDPALFLFAATVVTTPFIVLRFFYIDASGAQVSDALLGLTYIVVAIQAIRRTRTIRPDGLLVVGLGYIAVMALSLLMSPPLMPNALKLIGHAAYVLVPWLSRNIITDRAQLFFVVKAWLLVAVVMIGLGLAQVVTFYVPGGWDLLQTLGCTHGAFPPGPYPRICWPFFYPNLMADFMIIALCLLLTSAGNLLNPRQTRVAIASCVIVGLFTLSPGVGGMALAAALVIAGRLPRKDPRRTMVVFAGVALALGALLATTMTVVPRGYGHFEVAGRELNLFKSHRVFMWINTVAAIRDDPLIGVGYGRLPADSPQHDIDPWLRGGYSAALEKPRHRFPQEAHNTWLSVTAQAGFLGLFAFCLLLYQVIKRASREPLEPGPLRDLPLGLAAAGVGTLMFNGLFLSLEETRHLWLLAGLIVAVNLLRNQR